jgi:hypothetical protein
MCENMVRIVVNVPVAASEIVFVFARWFGVPPSGGFWMAVARTA